MNTEEISSLVKIPRSLIVSGNRTHQKISSFESLSPRTLLKYFYQRAGFHCPVERGIMWHFLILTTEKGNLIPTCRECSYPREFSCSKCVATIKAKNNIWTSLECACVETVWCSFYWGTDWITRFTKLHFMDIDMQRTWEICGRVAHLWQQSLHSQYFVAEAEGWSRTSCVDSQD